MYFQVQPFSRLISSSFSVRSDRFMFAPLLQFRFDLPKASPCGLSATEAITNSGSRHIARIVAGRISRESLAAADQEINDVVAHRVVVGVAVQISSAPVL